jgi:hypothetical protein
VLLYNWAFSIDLLRMTLRSTPSPRLLALLVLAATALLAGSFALVWTGARNGSAWDTDVYEQYGSLMARKEIPYRDFRVEYPPGALPTFVIPSKIAGPVANPVWEPAINTPARRYARWFALQMVVLLAATILVTAISLHSLRASLAQTIVALGLIAASPLLLGDLVYTRFDAWPAFLTALTLVALLRLRFVVAGVALGIGIATKLYPVLLLPLAVAYGWKRQGRRGAVTALAATTVTTLAVFVPFFALSPGGAWWPVRQQLGRGLQAESLGGSILAGLHAVTFQLHHHGVPLSVFPLHLVESAGSLHSAEVHGASGTLVGSLSAAVSLAVFVWAWTKFARGPATGERLVAFAAIVLTAQLAVGRVLSPQFVIWLLPAVPLVRGRRGLAASGVLVAVLITTHVWFPGPYRDYVNNVVSGQLGPPLLLLGRNILLAGLLVALVLASVDAHPRLGVERARSALRRTRRTARSRL